MTLISNDIFIIWNCFVTFQLVLQILIRHNPNRILKTQLLHFATYLIFQFRTITQIQYFSVCLLRIISQSIKNEVSFPGSCSTIENNLCSFPILIGTSDQIRKKYFFAAVGQYNYTSLLERYLVILS